MGIWLFFFQHEFYDFSYTGNVIIPTDFHIFQRGWNHQPAMNLLDNMNDMEMI